MAPGCDTCTHVANTVGVDLPSKGAIEAVADLFGEWLHRMHGVTSSCDHQTEATELLAFIREALHRDGDDADAIREALGLMFETRTAPDGWAGRYGREGFRIRRLTGGKWQEVPNDAR